MAHLVLDLPSKYPQFNFRREVLRELVTAQVSGLVDAFRDAGEAPVEMRSLWLVALRLVGKVSA